MNYLIEWNLGTDNLHSFPTRRSSDLIELVDLAREIEKADETIGLVVSGKLDTIREQMRALQEQARRLDRKSTRLNSSHVEISYAVFCLKKKRRPKIN